MIYDLLGNKKRRGSSEAATAAATAAAAVAAAAACDAELPAAACGDALAYLHLDWLRLGFKV